MLSPNLAFILFSKQLFTNHGLVFNLDFVQYADQFTWNNADKKYRYLNSSLFILPDSTRTRTDFVWNYPTCTFAFRRNTLKQQE